METGPAPYRNNFLQYVRSNFLIWLEDSPAASAAHDARFNPLEQQTAIHDLRARLRSQYAFPAGAAVAPALAESLDRYASLRALLGASGQLTIVRAQDPSWRQPLRTRSGRSAETRFPHPNSMRPQRAPPILRAPRARSNKRRCSPARRRPVRPRTPMGHGCCRPADSQTVHRIDSRHGLPVAFADLRIGNRRCHSGNRRRRRRTRRALSGARRSGGQCGIARRTECGADALDRCRKSRLDEPHRRCRTRCLADRAESGANRSPGSESSAPLVSSLSSSRRRSSRRCLRCRDLTTIRLDAALAAGIVAGHTDAATALTSLVSTLRNAGLSSAIPLIDAAGEVLLVVAVIGLPIAGINLNERRASGFRWYVVPISGSAGSIRSLGSHTVYHSNGPGLSAVVSIGYARQGGTDPYEYAIGLPDGAVLTVRQYEFLMNLLEATYPTGVTINTFAIRTQHVDLDGDGKADPLLPAQARTYRQFRRARYRGEASIGLDAGDLGL